MNIVVSFLISFLLPLPCSRAPLSFARARDRRRQSGKSTHADLLGRPLAALGVGVAEGQADVAPVRVGDGEAVLLRHRVCRLSLEQEEACSFVLRVPRPGSPRRLPGRCRRCRGPFAETAAAAAEAEVSGRRSGAHTSRYRFLTASKAPAWCAKSGGKQADGLRGRVPQLTRAGSPFSSHLVRSITSGLSPEGLSAMMLVFCGPGGSAEQGEAREAGGRRR